MKNTFVFLFALTTDQVTKHIAAANMSWHANAGISFGFFPKIPLWVFFALIFLMFYIKTFYRIKFDFSCSLFAAGVTGNLIDRVFLGYVIDWIPLPFTGGLCVNIADAALITGFLCFVFFGLKKL